MQQKATWMKHLIIGIISSFFVSCGGEIIEDPNYIAIYTFINKSEYSISIKKWKNATKKVFSLSISDSIVQEVSFLFGDNSDLILTADSLDIIFDNRRKRLLRGIKDMTSANILRIENYKELRDGNKYYLTYTFSNIDYDLAIPRFFNFSAFRRILKN